MHQIKKFAPPKRRKKGDNHTGAFDVSKSLKYIGKPPCWYRSGLELRFFIICENSKDIAHWESEPNIPIKYELHGKIHTYWLDAIIINTKGVKTIVEIKPKYKTIEPSPYNMRKDVYLRAKAEYDKNMAKWQAAYSYAQKHNINFKIFSE
jgi:hypothetical protein